VRRYVFDTNIFRYASSDEEFADRVRAYSPLAYSSVVLSELRRSATNDAARDRLERIARAAHRSANQVNPTFGDWLVVGEYLEGQLPVGKKPSAEALTVLRKKQNDALIAFSTWARGYVVVTCNRADFEPLAAFFKPAAKSLIIEAAPAAVGASP
jgi:predicted nucleic acid-binding protein